MAPTNLNALPGPSCQTRAIMDQDGYEGSSLWAGYIDENRARVLHLAERSAPPHAPLAAMQELAQRLSVPDRDYPKSMASCRYVLEHGLRLSGAFIDLSTRYGRPVEFRIYPPGLELPADERLRLVAGVLLSTVFESPVAPHRREK